MNPILAAFPDELDPAALQLVYNAWRGIPVDKSAATLAAINVLAFGAGKMLGQPNKLKAAPKHGTPLAKPSEKAIKDAIAGAGRADTKAAKAFPWALVFQIAMAVLAQLLKK